MLYPYQRPLDKASEMIRMVALPKSILASMRTEIYPRKAFTPKEFKTAFAKHGYGPAKTVKWLEYYMEVGLITELDDGRLTCATW